MSLPTTNVTQTFDRGVTLTSIHQLF